MAKNNDSGTGRNNINAVIKRYVQRLEVLEKQKEALTEDFSALNQAIKDDALDAKLIKRLVKDRKNIAKARTEAQMYERYCAAIQLDLFGAGADEDESEEEREAA